MATLVVWYLGVTAGLGGALAAVTVTQFAARRVRRPRRRLVMSGQPPAGRVLATPVRRIAG